MTRRSIQAPSAVVMIRPHRFTSNPQTLSDNAFQRVANSRGSESGSAAALGEVTAAKQALVDHGIRVHLFEDQSDKTPDSVFPNNWFSTHPGGHVALFPMYTPNRRLERRYDIIEMLKREYRVQEVIDYSGLEYDDVFLEGTGAIVIDHVERIAYAVRSNRTDPVALERFCTHFSYEPIAFDATDSKGSPIYHTNVLMCIATDFAMIGLDMISDVSRRQEIRQRFTESGRKLIELSAAQIGNFAGNAIELQGRDGRILALSTRAYNCLTDEQKAIIEESTTLLPLEIPTIELAGGSVRCMLAGVHLAPRDHNQQGG